VKVSGSDVGNRAVGDDKLKVLRRVAAEADTLSPDLLDQIIRAELARGRAKRYRARVRDGDDREQLERLAVELTDDWGTPPPSYRRFTPATGPTHRRQLWPTDSPARVHDLPPPDLPHPPPPPPLPERTPSTARPSSVPLDFRQFRRRPLPEIPRQESAVADRYEMIPGLVSRPDGLPRDVTTAASPLCDVIRFPLPVSVHAQHGGSRTGSAEDRVRRFPKMGRSCLLDSLRQRGLGGVVDTTSGQRPPPYFPATQSPQVGSRSCPCEVDLRHVAMTSWTRDMSHLPILRDTTV